MRVGDPWSLQTGRQAPSDLPLVDPIEKTAGRRDVIPRDVLDRPTRALVLGRIRSHHMCPQRLRHRRRHDVKVANLDSLPIRPGAEQERLAAGALDRREVQIVISAAVSPGVAQGLHGLRIRQRTPSITRSQAACRYAAGALDDRAVLGRVQARDLRLVSFPSRLEHLRGKSLRCARRELQPLGLDRVDICSRDLDQRAKLGSSFRNELTERARSRQVRSKQRCAILLRTL